MDMPLWSVGLVIDQVEAERLSSERVMDAMHPDEVIGIGIGPESWAEPDGPQSLSFVLYASSGKAAEALALIQAHRGRRAAGLPQRDLVVAWAAPGDDLADSDDFLREAEYLMAAESYQLAVVAADIHLEVRLKAVLRRAVELSTPRWVGLLMESRGAMNIRAKQGQGAIQHLLGLDVTQMDEWRAFTAHVARRNAILHEGQAIEQREASESIATIRSLTRRLAAAGRDAESRHGIG